MTVKLSEQKVSKIFRLYFQGFTQTAIAGKLGINQATVSFYITEFTAAVDEVGLEDAAKECGIMDIVKELHSLGAELKKSKLTAEEAKRGLKVAVVLEDCGVSQNNYKDAINSCIKVKNEGFLAAAVELHKIEESSGKSYQGIVKQAASLQAQVQQAEKKLAATEEKAGTVEEDLAALQQQKKGEEKNFNQVLQKKKMDLERLEKVENLAKALKKANITDKELDLYIQRHTQLNQANVPFNTFIQLLDATKVPIAIDGGKDLLKKLTEFSGLDETIISFKHKKQSLINETQDLDEKAKLKGALLVELTHLQTEKKGLEGAVSSLYQQQKSLNENLYKLNTDYKLLSQMVTTLTATVSQKQEEDKILDMTIEQKRKKVADLEELDMKRDTVVQELDEMGIRRKHVGRSWQAFEGFLGLVKAFSLEELRKAALSLPLIVEEAHEGKYSPEFLKNFIFSNLVGHVLEVYGCTSCGAKFTVDKPPIGDYFCPVNGTTHTVVIEKDATATLLKAMEEPNVVVRSIMATKNTPPEKQDSPAKKDST